MYQHANYSLLDDIWKRLTKINGALMGNIILRKCA